MDELDMRRIGHSAQWACAAMVLGASTTLAAEIGPCNELDRVSFLVGQTRSFGNGKIKVAHVDTDGEPVCCSSHLLIIIPLPEVGSQCFALSRSAAKSDVSASGFSDIALDRVKAAYDPKLGTLLTLPYSLYEPEGKMGKEGVARIRVDLRGEGSVKIER